MDWESFPLCPLCYPAPVGTSFLPVFLRLLPQQVGQPGGRQNWEALGGELRGAPDLECFLGQIEPSKCRVLYWGPLEEVQELGRVGEELLKLEKSC